MADDDDTIYIDVAARLDEKSVDEVEGKLKGKLSHVGDSIKDSLSTAFDSIGDRLGGAGGIGDKLHDTLAGAFSGKEWDNLGHHAGTALGRGVSDALKDVTSGNLGSVLGNFNPFGDVLGGALDKLGSRLDGLQKAGGSIGNVLSGNGTGNDLNNIIGGAKGLGLNIPGPINNISHVNDIINKMNEHPVRPKTGSRNTFQAWASPRTSSARVRRKSALRSTIGLPAVPRRPRRGTP